MRVGEAVVKLTNDEIEILLHRYAERIKARVQVCSNGNFRRRDLAEVEQAAKRVQELLRCVIWHPQQPEE